MDRTPGLAMNKARKIGVFRLICSVGCKLRIAPVFAQLVKICSSVVIQNWAENLPLLSKLPIWLMASEGVNLFVSDRAGAVWLASGLRLESMLLRVNALKP
ncbi:MAG: hypothetical protein NTZ46_12190 [Verrucomicrobia bacterium]|nr:hypothetical protein [Verrucomicrobiota bacterium]